MDVHETGCGELINRISRFDREIYRVLQREIREASEEVASESRRLLAHGLALDGISRNGSESHSAGWGPWGVTTGSNGQVGSVTLTTGSRDLSYDGSRAVDSIKTQVRKTRTGHTTTGIIGRVVMTDVGGAIFATAGKVTPGSRFNRALIAKWGDKYPRALGPAWTDKAPHAAEEIDRAIDRARQTLGL